MLKKLTNLNLTTPLILFVIALCIGAAFFIISCKSADTKKPVSVKPPSLVYSCTIPILKRYISSDKHCMVLVMENACYTRGKYMKKAYRQSEAKYVLVIAHNIGVDYFRIRVVNEAIGFIHKKEGIPEKCLGFHQISKTNSKLRGYDIVVRVFEPICI